MTQNLASKFSPKVDERFALASLTDSAVNQDYEWTGVATLKTYSVNTTALSNYTRSGVNRFGTPNDQDDTVQELTVSQDKGFTFTVDKGNDIEQVGAKNAGRSLRREIDEVVIPTVDIYRLAKMCAGAGTVKGGVTISAQNAYSALLDGATALTDAKVPMTGRVAFVNPTMYKFLKLDQSFIKAGDLAQSMLITGQVGAVDGMAIVLVPSSYLPAGVNFVITHKVATVSPKKLEEYRTHIDPPGISGVLVEGRIIYDAFVLKNKKKAIYVCQTGTTGQTGLSG